MGKGYSSMYLTEKMGSRMNDEWIKEDWIYSELSVWKIVIKSISITA